MGNTAKVTTQRKTGIGTKILLPLWAVFILFVVGQAFIVSITSQNYLTNLKQTELNRMSRILANDVEDMVNNTNIIAQSMDQNEQIAQLALFGPYYADPGSMLAPYTIAEQIQPIDDPEQIFALQASIHLAEELQVILQTNHLDNIAFYLTSPFDMVPDAKPVLALSVNQSNILISRFGEKGQAIQPNHYQVNRALFNPSNNNDFDISSVYSTPAETFYESLNFEPIMTTDVEWSDLSDVSIASPITRILIDNNMPILQTIYPMFAPLPHPETWEDTSVATGLLVIEQYLDVAALNAFYLGMGLDLGFAQGDTLLINTINQSDEIVHLTATDDIITLDDSAYYFSSTPIFPQVGGLQSVVFSPQSEIQAFISQLQRQIMSVALGLIIIGSLVVYIFIRFFITNPLKKLTEGVKEIERGALTSRVTVNSHDELGQLGRAFNIMTERLEELINSLEDRVNARTRDLTTAVRVSREITTVLQLDDLLPKVVELTAKAYQLYAVMILFPDEHNQTLNISASITEKNTPLPHDDTVQISIATHESLVAQAARFRRPIVVNDLRAQERHLFVDVLPDTQSELVIPMMLGNRLLGVFDLQSSKKDSFGEEEVAALQILAQQTAIAVRNAQLFDESRLARKQSEQANQAKTAFLASVSHELRTPLNAIINFTEFVKAGMMGTVNDKQVDALDEVLNASNHLLNLINDVLDMSKIESGSLSLYVEDDVNLKALLQQTVTTAESLLVNKPVTLTYDIADSLPNIRGDSQRILQILLNVISNACKFTAEGVIKIQASYDKDTIQVKISDTGAGIAEKDRALVFESFKQTETGIRDGTGTGLGMPISKVLAEAHGGRLWFESQVGMGTTFYIDLPIDSPILDLTN